MQVPSSENEEQWQLKPSDRVWQWNIPKDGTGIGPKTLEFYDVLISVLDRV